MLDKQALDNLQEIARYLRRLLEDKKYVLLFAYNGTGKTRLSAEFKTLGQLLNEETGKKSKLKGGTHKTVLEMFLGNGVACGLCRFSILQVIQ